MFLAAFKDVQYNDVQYNNFTESSSRSLAIKRLVEMNIDRFISDRSEYTRRHVIVTAMKIEPTLSELIPNDLVETMRLDAISMYGGLASSWLANIPTCQASELNGYVRAVVMAWLIKYRLLPDFYSLVNEMSHEVTIDEEGVLTIDGVSYNACADCGFPTNNLRTCVVCKGECCDDCLVGTSGNRRCRVCF